jgi:hypothetical protein
MILVFDLGGPLLAYALLRPAGLGAVTALVISGVLPALGIATGAAVNRRLDVIAVTVLAGILVGTILGLTSHDARLSSSRDRCPRSCSRWPAWARSGCGDR